MGTLLSISVPLPCHNLESVLRQRAGINVMLFHVPSSLKGHSPVLSSNGWKQLFPFFFSFQFFSVAYVEEVSVIPNIASWFELEASISPHFTDGSEEAYKLHVSLPNQGHSGNKSQNPEQSPDFYLHF